MSYKWVKDFRHRNKQRMIDAFGGGCGICGYNKSQRTLSFHHIEQEEKDFVISMAKITEENWPTIVKELKKCVMLCMNCHGEVHEGITQIPEDIKRFDETFSIYRKPKQYFDVCPICGKEKSINNKTCSIECSGKNKQKVDWDNIDILSLLKKYGSYSSIADELHISDKAVKKRLLRDYDKELINSLRWKK